VDPLCTRACPVPDRGDRMDALTHSVEAYVRRFHTPRSDMYCLRQSVA
jgi:alcohol dehydrogenase class IV